MTKLILTILLLLLPRAAGVDYNKVKLLRVYDGDTIVVDLPCEDTLYCRSLSVRIKGIDTPELRAKCAKEKEQAIAARNFTRSFLEGKEVRLTDCSRGKFFRISCNVYVKDKNLAQQLLIKRTS